MEGGGGVDADLAAHPARCNVSLTAKGWVILLSVLAVGALMCVTRSVAMISSTATAAGLMGVTVIGRSVGVWVKEVRGVGG
jgi:hypothetical protein